MKFDHFLWDVSHLCQFQKYRSVGKSHSVWWANLACSVVSLCLNPVAKACNVLLPRWKLHDWENLVFDHIVSTCKLPFYIMQWAEWILYVFQKNAFICSTLRKMCGKDVQTPVLSCQWRQWRISLLYLSGFWHITLPSPQAWTIQWGWKVKSA